MAPLGFSAVPDDDDASVDPFGYDDRSDAADPVVEPDRKSFLLVGSALAAVFVVGVAALVISLAVSIKLWSSSGPIRAIRPRSPTPRPTKVQRPFRRPPRLRRHRPSRRRCPSSRWRPAPSTSPPAPKAPIVVHAPPRSLPRSSPHPRRRLPRRLPPLRPPPARSRRSSRRGCGGPQLPSIAEMPGTGAIPAQSVPSYPSSPSLGGIRWWIAVPWWPRQPALAGLVAVRLTSGNGSAKIDTTQALIAENAAAFAALLRDADPSTPVPTCPEWTLEQLMRHVGRGDRWCAQIVAEQSAEYIDPRTVAGGKPAQGDEIAWLNAGPRALRTRFRAPVHRPRSGRSRPAPSAVVDPAATA